MKIVLLEPLGITGEEVGQLSEFIREAGHEFISYENRVEDNESLINRSKDADIVILTNLPFKKGVIERCDNLKMISVAFTGVDHIDLEICRRKGIIVSNSAGYSTNAVAELAFGLMIGLYRRLLSCDKATRSEGTKAGLIGFELANKKLGVLGTGAIGEKVIEIGQAFGCEILAYSRTKKQELIDKGVVYLSLDEVIERSDIISLHLPLNESTKGLIGEKQIYKMKKEAVLINTARGPIVDNSSLAKALEEERIAGAGIDVFEMEPPIPSSHPLVNAKNTLLAPHVAFATRESLVKRAIITFENVKKWLNGTPQNVIL